MDEKYMPHPVRMFLDFVCACNRSHSTCVPYATGSRQGLDSLSIVNIACLPTQLYSALFHHPAGQRSSFRLLSHLWPFFLFFLLLSLPCNFYHPILNFVFSFAVFAPFF